MDPAVEKHVPVIAAAMDFAEASGAVLHYLQQSIPMGFWGVSRFDGTDQVFLTVDGEAYGLQAGLSVPWADTMCQYATSGQAPNIAPDAMAVPAYAGAPGARDLTIGAYIGFPIRTADGGLFGSLCGFDQAVATPELLRHQPLLDLLSLLLGAVLQADLQRAEAARQLERVAALAESDPLTGLVNRRGWERFTALEEERYRRFGDPGSVIMLDLDGLKAVNDGAGHAAGDEYLCRAAMAVTAHVRATDIVARLGGDEFAILAARTSPQETEALVDRLRTGMDELGVPASVGHAPYTFVAGFPGAYMAADAAMYDDKRRRRAHRDLVGL